jgi:hypothetical protein
MSFSTYLYLFTFFCVCLHIVGANTYCVVFLFCLSSSCVLCTLCCQFLWIVYIWLPLWYSLTFICPVSCVPYVVSFSGLSIFDCPLVFPNVYLSCVLYTLCCQVLGIVYFWLPLWYSLTFICLVSCAPYVASFSGLSIFYCPFGIP